MKKLLVSLCLFTTAAALPAASWLFVGGAIGSYNVWSLNVNAAKPGLLSDNINVERTDAFTMSIWVKPNTTSPGWVFGNLNSGLPGLPGIRYGYSGTDIFLQLRGLGGGTIIKNGGATLTPNAWTMITVTYDGSSTAAGLKLYLNDSPVSVPILDDTLVSSIAGNGPTYVGSEYDGNAPWDGLIDEFKWYSAELSGANVISLYGAYFPHGSGNITGLSTYTSVLTWLRMLDGAGDVPGNIVNQKTPGTYDMAVAGGVSGDYVMDVP